MKDWRRRRRRTAIKRQGPRDVGRREMAEYEATGSMQFVERRWRRGGEEVGPRSRKSSDWGSRSGPILKLTSQQILII